MSKKHAKTLEGLFADPVRANIAWHDVESLLIALGAELSEGRGSRLRVVLNGIESVFHRPHPQKEAGKPLIRELRRFFIEAGVEPPE